MVVEGVTVCVRERKMYQKNIKNETQIHPSKNRYKIHIRKNDAIFLENYPKSNPKGIPKIIKNLSKINSKKEIGKRWSGPLKPGRPSAPVRLLKINKTH